MDNTLYSWSSPLACCSSSDRAVVVDLTHPDRLPVVLEASAAVIWECLEQPASVTDVAATLNEVYGLKREQAAESVRAFIDDLLRAGLVQRHSAVTLP